MDVVDACYEQAVRLLRTAATPYGFSASPSLDHYAGVWARDAAITSLGALTTDDAELVSAVAATLRGLAGRMSDSGQVPTAYWPTDGYWDWGDAGCTDASAWFVIALGEFLDTTGDEGTTRELWSAAVRALTWLRYQDANNFGLIDSPMASDWMDSSLSRSGKVLQVNVLYYWAARSAERIADILGEAPPLSSDPIRRRINTLFWPEADRPLISMLDHIDYPTAPQRLPHPTSEAGFKGAIRDDRQFFVAAVSYGAWVDLCDVQANLLAVVSGVADETRANLILDYLVSAAAADPFPTKTWPEPIDPTNDRWRLFDAESDRLQDPRWRNPPGHYHNGGIWPYVGGFHAWALARVGRTDEARELLPRLAQANRVSHGEEWGFHEWLQAITGQPLGAPHQTWNAGTYVLAFNALYPPEYRGDMSPLGSEAS